MTLDLGHQFGVISSIVTILLYLVIGGGMYAAAFTDCMQYSYIAVGLVCSCRTVAKRTRRDRRVTSVSISFPSSNDIFALFCVFDSFGAVHNRNAVVVDE